mgnify:CR=1 FL=1
MEKEKIIGWVLFGIGLLLCLSALLNAHGIFTGTVTPNQIMEMDDIVVTLQPQPPNFPGGKVDVMKADAATKFINLMFGYVLNVFVLMVGGKVSSIGISMVRDMKCPVAGR